MGDFDAHLFTIDETSLALREYRPAERTASFSSEKGNVQHLPLSEAFLGRQAGSARSLSVRLRSREPFRTRLQAPAWADENVCTPAIYLPAGLRGGRTRVRPGGAVLRIMDVIFYNPIALSGPEGPTLPEGE